MFTAEKKIRVRDAFRVGASIVSIGDLALKLADTPTRKIYYFLFFSRYPTLCVWGKHSAWQSTAEIGGGCSRAVVANIPRQFGQKPEPTYLFFAERKGKPKETKTDKQYLLRKR